MGRFLEFAKIPEMRMYWVLVALAFVVGGFQIWYFPGVLAFAGSAMLVVFLVIAFISIGRAAHSLRETVGERNQLRSIIHSMEDGLVVYDADFRVILFNPSAERLFQIKRDVLIGRSISPSDAERPGFGRLVQTLFPTLAPTMMPRSKSGDYPQIIDLSFENPTTELRTITSPIANEDGKLLGFMKIIRNRTYEVSLMKSKNEFVTVASHQLRTPLTNIEWTLQTLKNAAELKPENRQLVENAAISASQLKDIVEDLLNVAKIEEGRFGYQFESANIIAFLENILSEAMPQARRLGISLYFDKPETPLPDILIDSRKLGTAIANFLDNAIRYNVQNGSVTVKIEEVPNEPYLRVLIRDTGIGIPTEELSRLFVKFFRAQNALKSQTSGSGLGLYIAKNIIQAHGGQISVESEVNRGTTLSFTLPTDPSLIPPKEMPLEF